MYGKPVNFRLHHNSCMPSNQVFIHAFVCVCYMHAHVCMHVHTCKLYCIWVHVCGHRWLCTCGDLRLLWVSSSMVLHLLYWDVVSQSNPERLGAAFPASSRCSYQNQTRISIITEQFYTQTEKNCRHIHGKTCMGNFKEALFLINRKKCKMTQLFINWWINKIWYSHIIEHYSTMKGNVIPTQATVSLNLDKIMLREKKNQIYKIKSCMIPFI